ELGSANTKAFRAFVVFWVIVGIPLTIVPVLPRLRDDRISIFAGVIALLPLVWLSALAHRRHRSYWRSQELPASGADRAALDGRWFLVAVTAGILVAILSAAVTPVAMRGAFEADLLTLGLLVGLVWNAAYHAAIFCAAFLCLIVVVRLTTGMGFATQYACVAALVTAILAVLVRRT